MTIKPISIEQALEHEGDGRLGWISKFTMSEEEMEQIAKPNWVWPGLLAKGHLIAIVSEPTGGKTTILFWIAGRLTDEYRVIYVNADVSASDAKHYFEAAQRTGVELLLPDMKAGLSMQDVVKQLHAMNNSGGNYEGVVMIFDTLKKMADVISKSSAKQLYRLLRSLTAKGMTIVLLCHTNKYKDADGRPVYEGTGDLRSDVDELIYLIKSEQPDGTLYVSTEIGPTGKARAEIKPMTFVIGKDRSVRMREAYVDVLADNAYRSIREADQSIIELIVKAIQDGNTSQSEICKALHREVNRKAVLGVLKRHTAKVWRRLPGITHNRIVYELISAPPGTTGQIHNRDNGNNRDNSRGY